MFLMDLFCRCPSKWRTVGKSNATSGTFCCWTVCAVSSRCLAWRELGWFVYRLHSSFSVVFLLPFETSNYCSGMVLNNKEPHFPPTPVKYLAIILEKKKQENLSGLGKLLHPYKELSWQARSMQMWWSGVTCCILKIHMCTVCQSTIPSVADPFRAFDKDK